MARDKALLVGFRPNNFSQAMLNNPRLCFWHSTDPSSERKTSLPHDVAVVIMVQRICSKKWCDKVRAMLTPGINFVYELPGTGQVKKYLEESGYINNGVADTATPTLTPAEGKVRRSRSVGELYNTLVPTHM